MCNPNPREEEYKLMLGRGDNGPAPFKLTTDAYTADHLFPTFFIAICVVSFFNYLLFSSDGLGQWLKRL